MYTSNKAFVITFFLLVIAFMVSGCATTPRTPRDARGLVKAYSGPDLPAEKVAEIRRKPPSSFLWPTFVSIEGIDGKKIGYGFMLTEAEAKIGVEPGEHNIAVRLLKHTGLLFFPWQKGPFHLLSFEAEAGHKYIVCGKWPHNIWIEDAKTKKVICGRKPE